MTSYFTNAPGLPMALWSLPPRTFRALLLATHQQAGGPAYDEHLYELALSLVLEAPVGPPAGPGEFLDRLYPTTMATAWASHPGADRPIAAVLDGKIPPVDVLLAECYGAFRQWSEEPHTLLRAAAEVGLGADLARSIVVPEPSAAEITVARDYLRAAYDQLIPGYYTDPGEIEEFCAELSDQAVVGRINRLYQGGWSEFRSDYTAEIGAVDDLVRGLRCTALTPITGAKEG